MTDENEQPDEPKKAWSYERLSQDGREQSMEEQREQNKAYVRNRDDLHLVTSLSDGKFTSGFDNDRPKYQTIKEKIRSGDAEAIVAHDRARLSRDFDERLRLILLFRETGCELHIAEEGGRANLHTVRGAMMEAIKAAMDYELKKAEAERAEEITKERVEAGK